MFKALQMRIGPAVTMAARVWLALAGAAAALPAHGAGGEAGTLPEVLVIGTTPIPGTAIDADKVPGNVQILGAADLSRDGSPSLTRALAANLGSINLDDALDDPFQPDLLYRGFDASPVLGTPQGLAVYQNGVRINEAFGDTVNWDLIPSIAINQVTLVSSSPLYGLNALGGAVSVTMKNGFTYQGRELELSGGSHGQRSAVGQFGANAGPWGVYLGGQALDWDGWRNLSSDRIRTLYAALGYHAGRMMIDISYSRAQNQMNGQGAAPMQELAVNRSLVFTGPQENINDLDFFTVNATAGLADRWSVHGVLYYRGYQQRVANGNSTNYVACTSIPGALCQPDGLIPLTNAAGEPLPDISNGGATLIGENDFESIRTWSRGAGLQVTNDDGIAGLANQASLGATFDYAATSFYSGTQVGVLDAQLQVLPSNLYVYTPENSPGALANGDPTPTSVDAVNQDIGVFLTDTLNPTAALAVTASGRYNIARIDLADQLGANLTGSSRFVHFNPSVGATYKLQPGATLYAGWSVNNRTPTAGEIECSNPLTPCLLPTSLAGDPPTLRQVIAHTAELGVRGKRAAAARERGEVSWNLSAFRTLLHDDIYGVATSLSRGFFENIGDTRRQGIEAGVTYRGAQITAYANYSLVQATFQSAFLVPSPWNPYANAAGNIEVRPGDRFPGIPENRLKLGVDYEFLPAWTAGATVNIVGGFYYVGDQSNQLEPMAGYTVVNLHASYRPGTRVELFASVDNLFNRKYATYGLLSDPTGVGAPGVPANGVPNGPGVDNRFQSPAAPLLVFAGLRLRL